jgi:hypothetical protein
MPLFMVARIASEASCAAHGAGRPGTAAECVYNGEVCGTEGDMKALTLSALLLATAPSLVWAGEIYGSIKEGGKPVKEGVKVEVACAGKTVAGETDKNGAYRLFAEEEGKCTLTVRIGSEAPSIAVDSFEDSARYNLVLEKKDGKYVLRSE